MGFLNKIRKFFNKSPTYSMEDEAFLEALGINTKSKKALSEVTYFTCLRILSETIGKMPIHYFHDTDNGRERAEPDGTTYAICSRPNPNMTPTTFWGAVEANKQHYGNAYVWIQRNMKRMKYGAEIGIENLWVLPSDCVRVVMDNVGIFAEAGKIYYEYTDKYNAQSYVFPQDDVMHFKTSITFDGVMGKPVRNILKDTIDASRAGQEFIENINKNGMTSATTLEYSQDLDDARIKKIKDKYSTYLKMARQNSGVIPMPPGLKLNPVNMKLTDAQFYELRKYSALQIAAAFGIKPGQINNYEKNSYATSEAQQLDFLVGTVSYSLKSYEEEINDKCLGREKVNAGYFYRFNEKALLRTDSKTQAEVLAKYVNNGMYTVNNARDVLQLPHVPGGDTCIVNGNYIPITDVGKQYGLNGGGNDENGKH